MMEGQMEKRTITFEQAGLPRAKEERFPKRSGEKSEHVEKALKLLKDEAEKYPLHNVKMQIDHRAGKIFFSYERRDFELERLNQRIAEIDFQMKFDKTKRSFQ